MNAGAVLAVVLGFLMFCLVGYVVFTRAVWLHEGNYLKAFLYTVLFCQVFLPLVYKMGGLDAVVGWLVGTVILPILIVIALLKVLAELQEDKRKILPGLQDEEDGEQV